jgi:AcrR family transcriptional regulator
MPMFGGVARQKSDDKRNAIVAAAIRVIVQQGLSAPTATIAREAGIANGSLFTYFETKTELYNQLYLELKTEMASAALEGLPPKASLRRQYFHVWSNWTQWAVRSPEKRRALALLGVSDDITPASRGAGHETMAALAELIERSRADGPMRNAPFGLVMALMNAAAEATMDFMLNDPAHAEEHCETGFKAVWRMFGG